MIQPLKDLLGKLKLEAFNENLESILDKYPDAREAIIDALSQMTEAEIAFRRQRNVQYRIQQAKFGRIQTADTFDFNFNPRPLSKSKTVS